jgi:excisionase family DNA binding protein
MKRAYTVQEAADYLGLGISTVRQLIRDNTLPAKKQGTKTLLDVNALDAYFDALPEAV